MKLMMHFVLYILRILFVRTFKLKIKGGGVPCWEQKKSGLENKSNFVLMSPSSIETFFKPASNTSEIKCCLQFGRDQNGESTQRNILK